MLVVCFLMLILPPPPVTDAHWISNVLCPPYHTYLPSGNDCLFFLKACGNFSETRDKCGEKSAKMIGYIQNDLHFDDVCEFAARRVPSQTSFYLDARRKDRTINSTFEWNQVLPEVTFDLKYDQGEPCLVMTVVDNECYLSDSNCDESYWPLCEYRHVNPCMFNNGGCEGTCTPRHRGGRKCSCPDGQIAIGTKCKDTGEGIALRCPYATTIDRENNVCVSMAEGEHTLRGSAAACLKREGTVGLIHLRDEPTMDRYCNVFQKLFGLIPGPFVYHVSGYYMKHSKGDYFDQSGSSIRKSRLCVNGTSKAVDDPSSNCLMLVTHPGSCCIDVYPCNSTAGPALCDVFPPNICSTSPDSVLCPNGLQCVPTPGYRQYSCQCLFGNNTMSNTQQECVDLCKVYNGGCHHTCESDDTTPGRNCTCWNGFNTFMETECRYTDRCKIHDGELGCPVHLKLGGKDTKCDKVKVIPKNKHAKGINIFLLFLLFVVGVTATATVGYVIHRQLVKRVWTDTPNSKMEDDDVELEPIPDNPPQSGQYMEVVAVEHAI